MATAAETAKNTFATFAADVQDKAKTAYAKAAAVAGEIGTMAKGNVDAVVASGKVLGAGLKAMGEGSVAESRMAVHVFAEDMKALAAVKTPQDFFDLQMKLAKRNYDAALALTDKNAKAVGQLASDTTAPLSAQVKANVAKLRKAA